MDCPYFKKQGIQTGWACMCRPAPLPNMTTSASLREGSRAEGTQDAHHLKRHLVSQMWGLLVTSPRIHAPGCCTRLHTDEAEDRMEVTQTTSGDGLSFSPSRPTLSLEHRDFKETENGGSSRRDATTWPAMTNTSQLEERGSAAKSKSRVEHCGSIRRLLPTVPSGGRLDPVLGKLSVFGR